MTLAAGAVAGLAARLDFPALRQVMAQGVDVLVIEAAPFGAIGAASAAAPAALRFGPGADSALQGFAALLGTFLVG